ncbi:MAG TPA: PEP-CTERM sorting domain-containing protein [Tepidisphaeraceae bacterium]|jgi:hypothetical protein
MQRGFFQGQTLLFSAVVSLGLTASSFGQLAHRYSFTTNANDSVGSANGTLQGRATVGSNQLQFNNPQFSPASDTAGGYLSLPASIMPTSGSVTIEEWGTYQGSGFFTEAYTFTNHANVAGTITNPPGANNGQYLMHAISAPQPASPPGGPNTGGSHIAQALSGFAGAVTPPPGPETDAFGTTPGIGAGGGGGYLDDGGTYMTATVIDGVAGTLSYYLFRVSDGLGGLQQTITAIPLSSYSFTDAYLGRSAFTADNWLSGSIDEFRIYNNPLSAAQILADFQAGPNVVPEPASLLLIAAGGLLALRRRK